MKTKSIYFLVKILILLMYDSQIEKKFKLVFILTLVSINLYKKGNISSPTTFFKLNSMYKYLARN